MFFLSPHLSPKGSHTSHHRWKSMSVCWCKMSHVNQSLLHFIQQAVSLCFITIETICPTITMTSNFMTQWLKITFHWYFFLSNEVCCNCPSPPAPHPAPPFSPPPCQILLSRRRTHGHRQGPLRQVWTGALATHSVHSGEEIATHLLAGTAPS